eukprot:3576406-Rhodomonas_salina.4
MSGHMRHTVAIVEFVPMALVIGSHRPLSAPAKSDQDLVGDCLSKLAQHRTQVEFAPSGEQIQCNTSSCRCTGAFSRKRH